jgi:hypothetical protein
MIDSAPGSYLHSDTQKLLTFSLTGFKRLVGLALASLVYIRLQMRSLATGHPVIHDFIREGLNNPEIFPWMDSTTPRLYLYSDADQVSDACDIRAHMEAAKRKGLNVREECFLESQHVQHSRVYPDRYWGAVRSIWGDTVGSKL